MDLFKGKVAFVRKPAWIMKSMRGIKFTQKTKAIPHSKQRIFLLKENEEKPIYRDTTV
jgi:hypothetical protein